MVIVKVIGCGNCLWVIYDVWNTYFWYCINKSIIRKKGVMGFGVRYFKGFKGGLHS
jgi:hypothetical protein